MKIPTAIRLSCSSLLAIEESQDKRVSQGRYRLLFLVLVILGLWITAWATGVTAHFTSESIRSLLAGKGLWGVIAFTALFSAGQLLGISKRGNSYLRRLFVQGARAVLQQSAKQSSGLSAWLAQLTSRTHRNVAGVALANKLARMAWAVLAKNEKYRPPMLAGAATA